MYIKKNGIIAFGLVSLAVLNSGCLSKVSLNDEQETGIITQSGIEINTDATENDSNPESVDQDNQSNAETSVIDSTFTIDEEANNVSANQADVTIVPPNAGVAAQPNNIVAETVVPKAETLAPETKPIIKAPETEAATKATTKATAKATTASTTKPATTVTTTKPATKAPIIVTPITKAPTTVAPATKTPTTVAPSTKAPATNAPSTSAPNLSQSEFINEVLRLVNVERAKNGLSPLAFHDKLQSAAEIRAQEIKTLWSHTRPNGEQPWTAIPGGWQTYFNRVGENIAYGQTTPAQVMNGWMNSEGHRANILNPDFTHIGIGYYHNGSHYWSQMFGTLKG